MNRELLGQTTRPFTKGVNNSLKDLLGSLNLHFGSVFDFHGSPLNQETIQVTARRLELVTRQESSKSLQKKYLVALRKLVGLVGKAFALKIMGEDASNVERRVWQLEDTIKNKILNLYPDNKLVKDSIYWDWDMENGYHDGLASLRDMAEYLGGNRRTRQVKTSAAQDKIIRFIEGNRVSGIYGIGSFGGVIAATIANLAAVLKPALVEKFGLAVVTEAYADRLPGSPAPHLISSPSPDNQGKILVIGDYTSPADETPKHAKKLAGDRAMPVSGWRLTPGSGELSLSEIVS